MVRRFITSAEEKPRSPAISFALAIFFALTIRWGVAEAYVIPSGSMQPTLLIHDHIFVNKLIYGMRLPFSKKWLFHLKAPERGEVIVFKDPRDNNTALIKRIIGVPGDKITYHNNELWVNGQLVESRRVGHASAPVKSPFSSAPDLEGADFRWLKSQDFENEEINQIDESQHGHDYLTENLNGHQHPILHHAGVFDRDQREVTVPPGELFVMGDHRDNSADSRYWGFAPQENILGRASFVWLSCEQGFFNSKTGCDPTTIRWSRFLHAVN